MIELNNMVAVVTGAGSGIGKAISLALSSRGVSLCLTGRDLNKLKQVAAVAEGGPEKVLCCRVDLLDDDDIIKFGETVKNSFTMVDILVHSAGVIHLNPPSVAPISEFDVQYRTNVRAPLHLTQVLLPMMTAPKGQIVFVNSSAAMSPGIENGLYAATKSALRAVADSLRKELNGKGIRVLSIYPGRTAGPMQENIFKFEKKEYKSQLLMQAEDVASIVLNSLSLPWTAELTDVNFRPFYGK
jgi:NADP-dependent 3-hydroxy acid dehydrogenase YdfG